jgi:hypothetical protein
MGTDFLFKNGKFGKLFRIRPGQKAPDKNTYNIITVVTQIFFRGCLMINRGIFGFLYTLFNTASSAAPSDSTVSADDWIEPRTVATLALAVRYS